MSREIPFKSICVLTGLFIPVIVLKRLDYQVGLTTKLVRESSLAMYLLTDLNLYELLQVVAGNSSHADEDRIVASNTLVKEDVERIAGSKRVIDAFLSMLPSASGLEPSQIVLGIDGIRPDLYQDAEEPGKGTYFDLMRNDFLAKARAQGFEVIDMQPIFIDYYKQYHQRFEFSTDGHWNALAHELFAKAVRQTSVISKLFKAPSFQGGRLPAIVGTTLSVESTTSPSHNSHSPDSRSVK